MSETSLKVVTEAMDLLINRAREQGISPHTKRKMRYFSTQEVCKLLGRSTSWLYKAEELGVIEKPKINEETNRRIGYTLEQINTLRNHYSISPFSKKNPDGEPLLPHLKKINDGNRLSITVALYNFKGGVGKTTTCVNMAQYCALLGFKVLVIDMDSQASTSALFGIIGDDIDGDDTVLPYTLYGEEASLDYAIRETHFANLHIIPATQHLSSSEFEAVSQISSGNSNDALEYFQRLKDGIDTVKGNYDFVFVDAPPSLGIIGLQTLLSVDNIIIPCPPRMLDFVSTRQFLEIATEYVERVDESKQFNSIMVMASMYDRRNTKSNDFIEIMEAILNEHMYKNNMLHSESIDNASAVFQTPWESAKPDKRITNNMQNLFNEIINDLGMRNVNNA